MIPKPHEACDECGFDGARFDETELLAALRALGAQWRDALAQGGEDLRRRPAPTTWSAIEYAAHSRDITALHVFGVEQALAVDEPVYDTIADDLIETAATTYADADAESVVEELRVQATRLADVAAAAGTRTWTRGVTVGDSRMDIRHLLEHALHDSQHHLRDVERGYDQLGDLAIGPSLDESR